MTLCWLLSAPPPLGDHEQVTSVAFSPDGLGVAPIHGTRPCAYSDSQAISHQQVASPSRFVVIARRSLSSMSPSADAALARLLQETCKTSRVYGCCVGTAVGSRILGSIKIGICSCIPLSDVYCATSLDQKTTPRSCMGCQNVLKYSIQSTASAGQDDWHVIRCISRDHRVS